MSRKTKAEESSKSSLIIIPEKAMRMPILVTKPKKEWNKTYKICVVGLKVLFKKEN